MTTGPMDEPTPKYTAALLDTPMEETAEPFMGMQNVVRIDERPHTVAPAETMRPPPLPAHVLAIDTKRELAPAPPPLSSSANASPSPEEARRALEVLMSFIERQPAGFLDFQESMHIGKLMEKLKLHSRAGS